MRKLLAALLVASASVACNLSPGFDFPSAKSGSGDSTGENGGDGDLDLVTGDGDGFMDGSSPTGECRTSVRGGAGGAGGAEASDMAMGGACGDAEAAER